jgi:DNA-binding LacI/PurR family transcriptional regulator
MLWPPLTTMHQPIREMAYAGTRMLLEKIANGRPTAADDMHYTLVVRASTGARA